MDSQVSLSANFESICVTDNQHEDSNLSQFEKLPSELVLTIFEYVPEAVCHLRLTSRLLHRLVDEFLRKRINIPLVRHFSISDNYNRSYYAENAMGTMRLQLDVPVRTASLFELRLKCRSPSLRSRMTRWDGRARVLQINYYHLEIPFTNEINTADWDSLITSMGGSGVKKLLLTNSRDDTDFAILCKRVGQIRFEELILDISEFTEAKTERVLEFLKLQDVAFLSLTMYKVTASTVKFFREIASLVRSLHIRGDYIFMASNYHVKWAPLIIEMLSRRLDMLHLADHDLSPEDADLLIARLPFIGKKVWFKVTFTQNNIGRSNKINGHIIHVTSPIWRPNKPSKERVLSIIHKSRLKEVLPRGY